MFALDFNLALIWLGLTLTSLNNRPNSDVTMFGGVSLQSQTFHLPTTF